MSRIVRPTSKAVPLELGGKTRHLLLDFNALAAFEEKTGKNVFKFDWDNLSAKDTRVLIWACLLHEDPELMLEQVGSWMTFESIPEITAALQQVMKSSFPDSSGNSPNPPTPPAG